MESHREPVRTIESLPAALTDSTRVKKSKKVAFEIQVSEEQGSNSITVVASEPIKAGELLLEETPILSAPIAEFYDKVCHVCFKESPNVQRCSGCKYSHYCGQDHQVADWTRSHKKECGYFRKLAEKFPEKPLLHLLVLLVKTLVKIHDLNDQNFSQMFNSLPMMKKPSKKTNEISAKVAQAIRDLAMTKDCPEIEDLIEHTLRIMENSNLLQGKKNMDDWIACGVFPITKKVSHSCSPNSFTATNPGLSYRSVAARNIEKGEKITASFVDLDQDAKWRKQQLLENFSISCECKKCEKEEADPTCAMSPFLANKGYFAAPTSMAEVEQYVADCKQHLAPKDYAWFRAFDTVSESLKKISEHEFYFGLLQFMLPKYEEVYKDCRVNPVLGALYHKASVLAHRLGDAAEAVKFATAALRLLEPYFTEKHVLELKVILRHHQSYPVPHNRPLTSSPRCGNCPSGLYRMLGLFSAGSKLSELMDLTAKSLSDQTVFLGSLQTGPPTGSLVNNTAMIRCSPDDSPPKDWASLCSIVGWHADETTALDPADSELVDSLKKTSQNVLLRYEGTAPISADIKEAHKTQSGVMIGSVQIRDKIAEISTHVPGLLAAVIPAQTKYEFSVEFKESFKHLLQTPTAAKYLARGFELQLNTKMRESAWQQVKSRMSRTPAGQLLKPLLAQLFPVKNSKVEMMVRPTRLQLAMNSVGVSDSSLIDLCRQSVLGLLRQAYSSSGYTLDASLAQQLASQRFSAVTIAMKVGGGFELMKFRGLSLHYLFEALSKSPVAPAAVQLGISEPSGHTHTPLGLCWLGGGGGRAAPGVEAPCGPSDGGCVLVGFTSRGCCFSRSFARCSFSLSRAALRE